MAWDPWKPIGSKNKDSVFDPVDLHSNSAQGQSNNSWGFTPVGESSSSAWGTPSSGSNANSWAFSPVGQNSVGNSSSTSWAYQTGANSQGHWGHQQNYGFGDQSGFGNDHNLLHLESQQRSSTWGSCDGSSWHFSNTARDVDIYHSIETARRVNESNSPFSSSFGFSSEKSHFSSVSSFNPFSSDWGNKKK